MTGEKIHKRIAASGLCSRRDAEKLVASGRVRVNGRRVLVGERVLVRDRIHVDGAPLRVRASQDPNRLPRILLYHKPVGEICSRDDPQGRPSVYDSLPSCEQGRWISVGRLDFNTSGVLLFSDDGAWANRLCHPSSAIEREYAVRIQGDVSPQMLRRLRAGVMLEDGMARFSDVRPSGNITQGNNSWFYVVLMSGRNREVRRLWESQDVRVSRLKRVRFANIVLPPGLGPGRYKLLKHLSLTNLLSSIAPEGLAH